MHGLTICSPVTAKLILGENNLCLNTLAFLPAMGGVRLPFFRNLLR
jgi:hypothetical protein